MKNLKDIFFRAAQDTGAGCRLRIRDGNNPVGMVAGGLLIPFAVANFAAGNVLLGALCSLPPVIEGVRSYYKGRGERLKNQPPEQKPPPL